MEVPGYNKITYRSKELIFNKLLLLAAMLLASCGKIAYNGEKVVKKPNILFILADDLGYYDLSCMGSRYYETPNIDQIAAMGMLFTNGYATCQVCSPSRASLLTGKFPARHGITDWIGAKTGEAWRKKDRRTKLLPPSYVTNLPHEYETLPEVLRANGYKTFFAGKWHLGGEGSYPEDHGFDVNVGGWEKGSPVGGYFAPWKNPKLPNLEDGENLSMRLARETARFITDHRDSSFMAYLSFYAVHGPIQCTKEKWSKYREKAERLGISEKGFEMERILPFKQSQDHPVYAGLVEQMDDAVGIVLNTLLELDLLKNTVIVFTSDNGGLISGNRSATSLKPLRGGKGYQWEGGLKVPYLIYVPWMDHQYKKSAIPVTGTDFYPTLLELAGVDLRPEEHEDGQSLVPVLNGDSIAERPLYWHYPHYGNQGGEPSSIILMGNWKLIHYYEDARNELYDLSSDKIEQNDQAATYPDKARELSTRLTKWLATQRVKYPSFDPEYNEERYQEKLAEYRDVLMPKLETQRRAVLSKGWQPNENWWGSFREVSKP